jgi:hypothetical protein
LAADIINGEDVHQVTFNPANNDVAKELDAQARNRGTTGDAVMREANQRAQGYVKALHKMASKLRANPDLTARVFVGGYTLPGLLTVAMHSLVAVVWSDGTAFSYDTSISPIDGDYIVTDFKEYHIRPNESDASIIGLFREWAGKGLGARDFDLQPVATPAGKTSTSFGLTVMAQGEYWRAKSEALKLEFKTTGPYELSVTSGYARVNCNNVSSDIITRSQGALPDVEVKAWQWGFKKANISWQ